ncbi:Ppx/GppA family phosphatase [Metabacillus sp. GX 13764]|uniref:Ppx/GppA family phosphatase n=1 Tax=Metabacillus kandeliae TaxID=2900151 RepID=UPI001E5DFEF1|nr:Ppx/GppA family phosphatase [Metabacillus kandeliae]MCD7035460.1 Ppx/GppA family phosphatase [Metabacillus kandeliae]
MRLVIFERDKSGRLREIENVKAVARLRNYLTEDQKLSDEGIRVFVQTLLSFQEVTRHHNLTDIKCVATATIRQADNQKEILKAAEEKTDFAVRVLSEYEEAYYGYLAVVNSTSIKDGITIDIGGGSTEITLFRGRELKEYHSFPFGALSLKKLFVKNSIPTQGELKKLHQFLEDQLLSLPWLKGQKLPIIGIGGSARNLIQTEQALKGYPLAGVHQYDIGFQDIEMVQSYLTSLSFQDLQRVEGLSKDRADIIIPAIEVFRTLCELTGSSRFILSRKGLRDGVFFEELTKDFGISKFPNVIEESLHDLAVDFEIDLAYVFQVTKIAGMLYKLIEREGYADFASENFQDLKRSAFVYNLGQYIDSESSSQHTFYLLANRSIDGLFPRERLKIALIASYKSKASFKQYVEPFDSWYSKEEQQNMRLLGAILKISYSLNATRRNIVKDIKLERDKRGLSLTVGCDQDWGPEEYQVEKQKKHLEKLLKTNIDIIFTKN